VTMPTTWRLLVPHLPRLLGSFFAPRAQMDSMAMFPGIPNPDSLWGTVFQEALRQSFAAETPATAVTSQQAATLPISTIAPGTTESTTSSLGLAPVLGPLDDDDLLPAIPPAEQPDVTPVGAPASAATSRAEGSPEAPVPEGMIPPEGDTVLSNNSAGD
jgi:hypothetical protein